LLAAGRGASPGLIAAVAEQSPGPFGVAQGFVNDQVAPLAQLNQDFASGTGPFAPQATSFPEAISQAAALPQATAPPLNPLQSEVPLNGQGGGLFGQFGDGWTPATAALMASTRAANEAARTNGFWYGNDDVLAQRRQAQLETMRRVGVTPGSDKLAAAQQALPELVKAVSPSQAREVTSLHSNESAEALRILNLTPDGRQFLRRSGIETDSQQGAAEKAAIDAEFKASEQTRRTRERIVTRPDGSRTTKNRQRSEDAAAARRRKKEDARMIRGLTRRGIDAGAAEQLLPVLRGDEGAEFTPQQEALLLPAEAASTLAQERLASNPTVLRSNMLGNIFTQMSQSPQGLTEAGVRAAVKAADAALPLPQGQAVTQQAAQPEGGGFSSVVAQREARALGEASDGILSTTLGFPVGANGQVVSPTASQLSAKIQDLLDQGYQFSPNETAQLREYIATRESGFGEAGVFTGRRDPLLQILREGGELKAGAVWERRQQLQRLPVHRRAGTPLMPPRPRHGKNALRRH